MTSDLGAAGSDPSPPREARGAQALLADLTGRLTEPSWAAPEEPAARFRHGEVFDSLEWLARLWHLVPKGDSCAVPLGQPYDIPGPALVAMQAERLGLQVTFRQTAVRSLKPGDLPCLVLLATGGCHLVLAQEGDSWRLRTNATDPGGTHLASPADVGLGATGTIIMVQPGADASRSGFSPLATDNPGQERHTDGPSATPFSTLRAALTGAMGQQRGLLAQLIVASVIINLFSMLLPLFSMAVFDRVIPHAAMETLWAMALGVGLALGLEFALRKARLSLFDAAGQSVSHTLQGRVMSRLFGAKIKDLPRASGALVQPMQDLDAMAHLSPQLIVAILVDLPFFVALVALLAFIAGPVAFAPVVGALVLVAIHLISHRLAHGSSGEHTHFQRRQQQMVIDGVGASERIRITGAGQHLLARWDVGADAAGFAAHRNRFWNGLAAQGGAILVQAVMVVTIIIGVYRIDAAMMTIGALSASILLVNRAMMPISIATSLVFRALQLLQTASPVAAMLTVPIERGGDQLHRAVDDIAMRFDASGVGFSYPGEQRQMLKDIGFSIKAGEKVGIIGKAGCGKSTLLRLLLRLHDADSGRLCLDGRDIRQFDPAFLRGAIGFMPQDSQLLDGTLEYNLTLGLEGITPAGIERIARLTGVHEIASAHPSGYSLEVGAGGSRLSGGERQAVGLTRALMGDPALVVLDEPTAAFDNAAEARLVAELRPHLADKGLIVATHRLPVLALVDRIIWMDGGRIVADGPKSEIFARFGIAA